MVISIFLIDDVFKLCVIYCGFGVEDYYMGGVQYFVFVECVVFGSGFCYVCFVFFCIGDNKVLWLGIGVGGVVLQQCFYFICFFGGQFFVGIECFSGVVL